MRGVLLILYSYPKNPPISSIFVLDMITLTIHIPDKKAGLIRPLLKELDITTAPVVTKKNNNGKSLHLPNSETVKAIENAGTGKTKHVTDFKAFWASV